MRLRLLLVLQFALSAPVSAGTRGENPHLSQALRQLRALEETAALRTLEKARTWPGNSPREIALYHLYSGLAYAGLAQRQRAVEAFRTALLIEPGLELPLFCGPRVIEWFEDARGTSQAKAAKPAAEGPALAPAAPLATSVSATQAPSPALIGIEATARASPSPPPPAPYWSRWTHRAGLGAVVTGVLALVAGGVLGKLALDSAAEAEEAGHMSEALGLQQRAQSQARAANYLFAGGGAVCLGGGLLLAF